MIDLRSKILTEFYNSIEVNDAISKMHPIELQEDLKGELFLILAELPEEKLIGLYQAKQLRFYVVRVMLNLVRSTDKKFYAKYRNFVEYEEREIADESQADPTEFISKYFEGLYWYEKELLRLYTFEFNRNARQLSRATGIPYMSIIRTLNKTKQDLKSKIRK
ncbi:hypothetical protein UFOVP316_27 [uncultured Caudovirales phage]|uniref:Uncharacterized protein n=1 Tax=uncultured Caudovirales phage TaxID=2100421 RepID=A0A6J5LZP3_9CAUD|nr:hypothetical protein UFOVP316_27 [uncultured Caudovirales phage]